MFSNFLYFLIALVIYTTADLFEAPATINMSGLYYGIISGVLFALVCHFSFKRLTLRGQSKSLAVVDQSVNLTISRLSIIALMLFAANIYVFRLKHILGGFPPFQWLPTLEALFFLGVFLLYLVLIWNAAYKIQKQYFPGSVSKKSFIFSNIAFALPALLPWCCLSLMADLIAKLPYAPVREFFATTTGEVLYIFVFLTAVSVFGPVLIHRLWGCKPLPQGYARARIEATCRRAGLKYKDILKWELFGGSMITAGVMGIVGRFRYILVTPALLSSLDDDEIDGVMLHEIGHVQRYHMLFYLFFFAGFIACNFVFFEPLLMLLLVAQPVYEVMGLLGIGEKTAHPLLICLGMIGFFIVYFRYIFGFFMRHFERQADLHIFNFQSSPSPLISTFYKIASMSRQSIDKPNWHHFSIGQRIRFLENCRENPALIGRHHSRVRKMILGYAVIVALLFSLGYNISYGSLKPAFERYIAGKILVQQLAVDPENSDLYVFVGDYYYNDKLYAKARDAYENVLRIDPKNVHALNNLSWLLSTCPDEAFRDPLRALDLAEKALNLESAPHILDTYAEALFLNGRRQEAFVAARNALELAKEKRDYYEGQVNRFKESL
ncbi:MAG TPA: peptidase [Desulfobacteraceae bacterium]|nr:peptidase [Desulfobacteraceae bacterium]|tara:strand:+ start:425 stop:2245 length:1821 start_codon:yes stop_codon:yes gene_type:complete